MTDFFISYTSADEKWAEWIAWIVEAAGFSVALQKWDFRPGSNFVIEMRRAATGCERTIAVLSPDYLQSAYAAPEWAAAFASDPEGLDCKLVPVRVAECTPDGLLKPIVFIDLVGLDEEQGRQALLEGLAERRAKPSSKPDFPGPQATSPASPFPRESGRRLPGQRSVGGFMPQLRGTPSDLDRRRFLKHAFEVIQRGFEARLTRLTRENPQVETDLTPVDATKFTAEIYVNGQSRARCKIWQGGMVGRDGISFAEGTTTLNENACNEVLTLARDGTELALHATMNIGLGGSDEGLNPDHLSAKDAAEYLWRRFTWGLRA